MFGKIANFIVLISILLFAANCQQKNHQQIDEDTFVKIYCDVVSCTDLVEATKKQALIDSIMQQYHVNYADYQHKLEKLKNNSEEWHKIYDKIVRELENRIKELDEKESENRAPELKKMKRLSR